MQAGPGLNLLCRIVSVFLLSICCLVGQAELMPTSTTNAIYKKAYYTLSYSEEAEQAEWVYYKLTSAMLTGIAKRSNNFKADRAISTGSATLADYKYSGYDRGHLAPAADMKVSSVAMSESFLMSNMSPQIASFNRGIWKRLESSVRGLARQAGVVYVITAGVLLCSDCKRIGSNKVLVPKYYYKIVYIPAENRMQSYLLPTDAKGSYEVYRVSVDKIEQATGIDFFAKMSKAKQDRLESVY